MTKWCWASFHMSLGPLYVLFEEVSVQALCPFFIGLFVFQEWSCVSSLYILEIKPLSEVHLQIYLPYSWFPFHFNAVFFSCAEAFYLTYYQFFIISFIFLVLADILVKILLCRISKIFLPMFSSRTFMVSWLIFKSFVHLEFIFVYGVSWWSSFSFLLFICSCPALPTICWRGYFYSILCSCPPF